MADSGYWSPCATYFLREVTEARRLIATKYPRYESFEETEDLGWAIIKGERVEVGTRELFVVLVRSQKWLGGRMQEVISQVLWVDSELPAVGEQVRVYECDLGMPACRQGFRVEVWFRAEDRPAGSKKKQTYTRVFTHRVIEEQHGGDKCNLNVNS